MVKGLAFLILFISIWSCQKSSDSSLEEALGITPPVSGPSLNQAKVLKILQAGTGETAEVFDVQLDLGQTLSFKAALFSNQGEYLEEVKASWTLTSSIFPSNNLSLDGAGEVATFIPSVAGVISIRAQLIGNDPAVVSTQDFTGLITVTDPANPGGVGAFRVLKILHAGIGETPEVYDETLNMSDTLSVKAALFDTQGNYIEDVLAQWSFSNSQFPSNTLSLSPDQMTATFTPAGSGVVMIKATFAGSPQVILNTDFTGTITVQNPGAPNSFADLRIFKIIEAGAGNQPVVENVAKLILDPTQMKGALFDMAGNYVSDAPAIWSFSNNSFPLNNLTSSMDAITATFIPSTVGTVVINAIYTGGNVNVISAVDSTGIFSITNIQVPDSILLVSGNNQSGTVNTNLAQALRVQVRDEFHQAIPGVSVQFQVTQGSGSIIGTNPVVTDSSGFAEVIVKLGTQAGGNNNQYRAIVSGYPALLTDFQATALAGPQHQLVFTTQPAILFANMAFGIQPVVELRDEFGNHVSAAGTITMSKAQGTGNVGGVTTASMSNGVATFSGLLWDTAEPNVILHASNGSVFGLSSSLNIGSPPPGACVTNDVFFQTADGGCKDMNTGLVWSAKSATAMNWYSYVWDARHPSAPAPDAEDYGRTNDYPEANYGCDIGTYNTCDVLGSLDSGTITGSAYCKNLNEGGKSDWRATTQAELTTMAASGGSSRLHQGAVNEDVHVSDTTSNSENRNAIGFNITNGVASIRGGYAGKRDITLKVYCVRGGNRAINLPTKITVDSGLSSVGVGNLPSTGIQVQIKDAQNNTINLGGITLTLSSNLGTVGGANTAVTDYRGRATFSAFTLDTVGSATLTISYNGGGLYSLTPATHQITVGSAKHTCAQESSAFQTQDGGCKDMVTGLVWSAASGSTMSWYQAIWDNTTPGAPAMDADDFGRGSDYSEASNEICTGGTYINCDNPSLNTNSPASVNASAYCKSLVESGYSDWRMPTRNDFLNASNNGLASHFVVPSGSYWTSSAVHNDNRYSWAFNTTTNLERNDVQTSTALRIICVRGNRQPATKLAVTAGPAVIGLNQAPGTAFTVRVQDASNNNTYSGNRVVTLSAIGSGISGTLTSTTDFSGAATFDNFQLNTLGSVTLVFSTPGLADATMVVDVRNGVGTHLCALENGRFSSRNGGCFDNVTNLAWSTRSNPMTWLQAVWDSAVGGAPAPDLDDGVRVNDYDPATTLTGNLDTDPAGYCKSLSEGGYTNWRLPTRQEWEAVFLAGANTTFMASVRPQGTNGIGCYWTSTSAGANSANAQVFGFQLGTAASAAPKNNTTIIGTMCDGTNSTRSIRTICVREHSP